MRPELETLYAVFLVKGTAWTAESTPEVLRTQEEHLAHLARLAEEGKSVAAGPFLDGGDLRGLVLLRAPDAETASRWAEADPAVISGRLACQIRPWGTPVGTFNPGGSDGAAPDETPA